jgi:hypothetical protein
VFYKVLERQKVGHTFVVVAVCRDIAVVQNNAEVQNIFVVQKTPVQ